MSNHISFINQPKYKHNYITDLNSQTIYLQDPSLDYKIFDIMPRLFTITTNNGSSNFNIDLLKDTSSVISEFNEENPNYFQYHLDIKDERNVLQKFERMYQGKNGFVR